MLSIYASCSGAALLYALIAQRRSGAFAPTALLVPVCFLVVQLIVTYRANARDSVLGHFYVELLLLAALLCLLLAAGDAGFDGVIVAGDLFGGSCLLCRLLLLLLHLLGLAPDHKFGPDDLNALRARRFAQSVADLAGRHHCRFQHTTLDQLMDVEQLLRLGDERLRHAALSDHEGCINCICLRAQRSAFLTCHGSVPLDIFCKNPAERALCGKLRFSVRSAARHTSCQAREDKKPGRSRSRFPRAARGQ